MSEVKNGTVQDRLQHVLDSLTVEDEPDMAGKEILERHVRVKYPEAHLLSWDSFSVRSEGQWVIVSRTPTSEG